MKIHFLEFLFQNSVSSLATFSELVSHMCQRIRKKENELEHGKYVFQPSNSRPIAKNTYFANKNESCDLEVPCSSQYCVLKLFLHTSFKKKFFCYFLGRARIFPVGRLLLWVLFDYVSGHPHLANTLERAKWTLVLRAVNVDRVDDCPPRCADYLLLQPM